MRLVQRRFAISATALALLLGCFAVDALARQSGQQKREPILTKDPVNQRDWTLNTEVRLHPYQYRALQQRNIQPTTRFNLNGLHVVYPLIPATGMSIPNFKKLESKLEVGNVVVDEEPRIVSGYQAGTNLGVWEAGEMSNVNLIVLKLSTVTRCYETRIDEERAFQIPWPTEPWSDEIASCLEPQLFIESRDPRIRELVDEWTNGKPRRAKPYYLAKYLAAKVLESYQPSGSIYETTGRGPIRGNITAAFVSGYRVEGAVHAAVEGRGSPLDLANYLTAVYRAAGIPARLVIGFDVKKSNESAVSVIRAWTEFYLYDERHDVGEWIPVDIYGQRKFGSRAPAIDQRWQFFGHNEEFDFIIPFAFHWHPPTAVTNLGAPAVWGWIPEPDNPAADQEVRYYAFETPKRAEDMQDDQKNP